jgi:hypothetical protein
VLDILVAYRFWIARLLRWIVAMGLVLYLAQYRNWTWYQWAPVAIAALLLVPIAWGLLLGVFERRDLRRRGWPL